MNKKKIFEYMRIFGTSILIFFIFYFLTFQQYYIIVLLALLLYLFRKNLLGVISFLFGKFYFVLFSIDFVYKLEFITFFSIIILIFLVSKSQSWFFVNLFFWIAVSLIYISIFRFLHWTYNPFRTWEEIVNKMLKTSKKKSLSEIKTDIITSQEMLYSTYIFVEIIRGSLSNSIKSETYKVTLMKYFSLYLLTYFTFSIFLYSRYYYTVSLIKPAIISGMHSLTDSFYFTFLTFATIGDSSVGFHCWYIKFIVMTQVFIGLFLLIFIFLSFSSISISKSEQSFGAIHSNIQEFLEKDIMPKIDLEGIEKKFFNKTNLAKEMFEKLRKFKEKNAE